MQVIKAIYGENGSIWGEIVTNRGYNPWLKILASFNSFEEKCILPPDVVKRKLSKGYDI